MSNKISSALAAGAVTIGLLLGASAAQATTVVHTDGNTVTGVSDLEVLDKSGDFRTVYNVAFLETTAADLYGVGLVPQLQDENAMLGRIALINALNADIPVPSLAGPDDPGSFQFFIGAFKSDATMVAVGGEFESRNSDEWDWCRDACDPFGVNTLLADETKIFASFTVVPVPAAVWLFGSGLLGLVGIARCKKA